MTRIRKVSLLVCYIQLVVCKGEISQIHKVYKDLFSNYTKSVMPVIDHSQPLYVDVSFFVASINSYNEVDETISITGAVFMKWTDIHLKWDPVSYGYTYYTFIDNTDIWVPLVVLTNNVNKMEPLGSDTNYHVYLLHSGTIMYSPADILEAKCPADISKFPFDEQSCRFEFIVWGLTQRVLMFTTNQTEASLRYFVPNSDWKVLQYSTKIIDAGLDESSSLIFELKIKRSSLYYGIMIIAPTVMFALLNPVVFLLPVESGERVGLSMTILLSYAIFLTLVSTSIPAASNPMCVLLIVMMVIIGISGCIVFGVIISMKYYYTEDVNKIGPCFRRLGMLNKKRNNYYKEGEETKLAGKDVADMLDFIFLCGSYIVMIIITVGYILYINT